MSRRDLKRRLLLRVLAVAASAPLCAGEPAAGKPLNILLISIDTLRADHLGCYG